MSKCVVFSKYCSVHLKNASACPIELSSCSTMSVAILLEPYVVIRLSVYFCNNAPKSPFSEFAADSEVIPESLLDPLDVAIVKSRVLSPKIYKSKIEKLCFEKSQNDVLCEGPYTFDFFDFFDVP